MTILMLTSLLVALAPTASAADWTKKDLGNVGGAINSVATGDGNNDNADEVYAASSNGGVYEFKQVKDDPKDWKINTLGFGEGQNFQMRAVMVGDGRDSGKTAVYAGGYDQSTWTGKMYEFVKTGDGWNRLQMGTGGWVIFDVDIGDGDNDDRNEVYAASYDGRVYEYSYSNSWNSKDIGYSDYYQRGVAVGDGDNDGKVEVYSTGGWSTGKHAYRYKYNSGTSSWDQTDLGQLPHASGNWGVATDIDVGDGDNDGKNELYVTDYQYVHQLKLVSGTWVWTTIFTNVWQYQMHVDVGDGDADGKNEVYVASATDQIYKLTYNSGNWGSESIGSGNGDMLGVAVGNGDLFGDQLEVYGGCADSHVYQFMVDKTPPPNPKVWSPTHEPDVWSNNSNVKIKWRPPPDPSGIDGYSFEWSTEADTIPDDSKDVEETVTGTESGPLADGDSYYFHIKARDNALNWNPGATHFGPLKIDTEPPGNMSLTINDDAQYTNQKLVTLDPFGFDSRSGMGFMAFSNDGTTWPDPDDWEEWNSSRENWDLTSFDAGGNDNDGNKTVYMKARDKAGNMATGMVSDTIFLDRTKPEGLSIKINGGDQYTNDADVDLTLTSNDPSPASGLYKMRFSNDGVNWSDWESWNTLRSGWSLISDAGGDDSDGTKKVYFQVKDRAGNVAGPLEDDIFLDRKAPGSLGLVVNGGDAYTNVTNVKLNITAVDPDPGTGANWMHFSNDATDYSSWEQFADTKNPWSLTEGAGGTDTDGSKGVYLEVKDGIDNIGGPVKDDIFLDRAKPIQLSITINDGASLTNTVDVTLTLSATDPDPASGLDVMQVRESGLSWGSWEPWTTSKSFTLSSGDGTKTVMFRVKDKAGNLAGPASDSIVLDTTAPIITNIKVIGITDTSAIVTWTTDSPADSTVDYGTTASYGNQKADATFVSDHSVTLTGLTPETLYHFRVVSSDEVGNGPTVSGDHTFKTKATPDTTPPVITNLRVEGITDTLAMVLWDTNEPADDLVQYGVTEAYGSSVGSSSHVQKHTLILMALTPDTEYFFMVESTDASGNGPVSEKGQFRTKATPDTTPPVITNVKVSGITNTMAVITWTTDEVADSIVEFGTTASYGNVVTDAGFVKEHMATLSELSPATTYYFIVRSTDMSGNGPTTSAQYTFVTTTTADTTPPIISNVKASGITNTMAVITWTTDELADGVVDHGKTVSYGDTANDLLFVLSHSMTLTGLTPSTTYHFRVGSSDISGNGPTYSEDYTLTTKAVEDKEPPIIEWVKVEGIRSNIAVVLWKTNEPADSEVVFGKNASYDSTIRDDAFVTDHSVVLKDLNASTTYYFIVRSTDISGNGPTESIAMQFTTETLVDMEAPTIHNVTVVDVTKTSARIEWRTNEPGSTLIAYGKNLTIGSPIGDSEHFYIDHSFDLQDLEPGTTYSFMIFSDDPSGNRGSSSMYNFTTVKEKVDPPPPGPGPIPGLGDDYTWLYIIILIAVIVALVLGAYAYYRLTNKPMPVKRGAPKGRGAKGDADEDYDDEEAYDVEEMDMDDEDVGSLDMDEGEIEDMGDLDMDDGDLEDVGTLDMGEDAGDLELGGAIAAITGGTAAVGPPMAAPKKEPVRKVRCPGCKTPIPIYSETQTDIKCPNCGKAGKIKPMKKAAPPPVIEDEGSPLASVLGSDLDTGPKPRTRPSTKPRTESRVEPKRTPLKTLTCSGCKGKVPVYTAKRPIKITCPSCDKSGTLKK